MASQNIFWLIGTKRIFGVSILQQWVIHEGIDTIRSQKDTAQQVRRDWRFTGKTFFQKLIKLKKVYCLLLIWFDQSIAFDEKAWNVNFCNKSLPLLSKRLENVNRLKIGPRPDMICLSCKTLFLKYWSIWGLYY